MYSSVHKLCLLERWEEATNNDQPVVQVGIEMEKILFASLHKTTERHTVSGQESRTGQHPEKTNF